jgi:hypothetical protein
MFSTKRQRNFPLLFLQETPAPAPPANLPLQQFNDISDLKTLMKILSEEIGTMINLLTTVLIKLK